MPNAAGYAAKLPPDHAGVGVRPPSQSMIKAIAVAGHWHPGPRVRGLAKTEVPDRGLEPSGSGMQPSVFTTVVQQIPWGVQTQMHDRGKVQPSEPSCESECDIPDRSSAHQRPPEEARLDGSLQGNVFVLFRSARGSATRLCVVSAPHTLQPGLALMGVLRHPL